MNAADNRCSIRRPTWWAILVAFAGLNVANAQAQKMYWTAGDRIQRSDLDGSNIEDVVIITNEGGVFAPLPRDLAIDWRFDKMYWTAVPPLSPGKIQRANLDGSEVEDLIVTGIGTPSGIALDLTADKMYWTDAGAIYRANLDGSNRDLLMEDVHTPLAIALDVHAGKMYWTDVGAGKIQRANLDGSDVEDLLVTGLEAPAGIALDLAEGKMYWNDVNQICRADLDGGNVEVIVTTDILFPVGLALDVSDGRVYWVGGNPGQIQRANIDGTNVEDLVSGLGGPFGIALDVTAAIPAVSEWSLVVMVLLVVAVGTMVFRGCMHTGT